MEPSSPQPVSRVRRLLRYLRVGFSVGCGAVCVLLMVLWVRSHWVTEAISRYSQTSESRTTLLIFSGRGTLTFVTGIAPNQMRAIPVPTGWTYSKLELASGSERKFAWVRAKGGGGYIVRFPAWLPVFVFAILALAPKVDPIGWTANRVE